jgi:hypothetical protein
MIATGFNRNHMVTNETGIIEVSHQLRDGPRGHNGDGLDGPTLGCALPRHKYDPLTQRDYCRVFSLQQHPETGLVKDVAPLSPAPTIALPTAEQDARLDAIIRERKQSEAKLKTFKPALKGDDHVERPRLMGSRQFRQEAWRISI